jgi:hypothetical protein
MRTNSREKHLMAQCSEETTQEAGSGDDDALKPTAFEATVLIGCLAAIYLISFLRLM